MKKKWIICALAILFIISEGERNGLRNDNRGGDICPACRSLLECTEMADQFRALPLAPGFPNENSSVNVCIYL